MKNFFVVLAAAACLLAGGCDTHQFDETGLLVPKTVDEDPSLPSIFVNGTQLHSEAFGNQNDPMIVVIHGGPGSDYRSILNCRNFAAEGFFVVFYDQRGCGLSKRHEASTYYTQLFIDDLDAVISYYRQSPAQKVILMGHSWGAMLATAYINEHPGSVSGAVLMEPGGFTWHDAEEDIKRSRKLDYFDEATNDFVFVDQMLTGHDQNTLDYRAALQNAGAYAKGNKVGNPGPVPFWRPGAVCAKASFDYVKEHPFDFTTNLRQYTTKVLFIYSELNVSYGREHAQLVSSAYPNVQLEQINGVGHEMPCFAWDAFHAMTKPYLDSIK